MTEQNDISRPQGAAPVSLDEDVARLVKLAEPRREIPADRLERMQAELRPLWQAGVSRTPARRRRLALAAAVVVLGLGALFAVRALFPAVVEVATVARLDGQARAWREAAPETAELLGRGATVLAGGSVATAEGARLALDTAQGRSVRLDGDSRVVWLSRREVRLEQGAIYVDSPVTASGEGGLTVVTPLGRVREMGTQFEVRLSAYALTVRIREGSVELGSEDVRHRGSAGEEMTLTSGRLSRRPLPPDDPAFDWTQEIAPAWELDGSRLSGFLAWAARESGRPLSYADGRTEEEARAVVLAGEIEGLGPAEALAVVLPAVGFRAEVVDGALVVRRSSAGRAGASSR